MQEFRRILKVMDSAMIRKLCKLARLDDAESKIMIETYIKRNTRDNVCEILNISISTFNAIKNKAESKAFLILNNLLDEKINQMA